MTVTTGGRGRQMVVDILVGQEAGLDVALGDPAHGVAELGGHEFGGVGIDDVGDLEHHALAGQELDDLDAARWPCGRPAPAR